MTKKAGRSLCQVLPGEKGPIPRLTLMQLNNVRQPLRMLVPKRRQRQKGKGWGV